MLHARRRPLTSTLTIGLAATSLAASSPAEASSPAPPVRSAAERVEPPVVRDLYQGGVTLEDAHGTKTLVNVRMFEEHGTERRRAPLGAGPAVTNKTHGVSVVASARVRNPDGSTRRVEIDDLRLVDENGNDVQALVNTGEEVTPDGHQRGIWSYGQLGERASYHFQVFVGNSGRIDVFPDVPGRVLREADGDFGRDSHDASRLPFFDR